MKYNQGKSTVTIILILLLAAAASGGWYLYYAETAKFHSLSEDNSTELATQKREQNQLQTTLDRLRKELSALQTELASEKDAQRETATTLAKTTAAKVAAEAQLEAELIEAKSMGTDLQMQLETHQATISKQQEALSEISAKLKSREQARQQLVEVLASTRADKFAIEARLRQDLNAARQAVANLELELENLQANLNLTNTQKAAMESELRDELSAAVQNVTELETTLANQQTRLDQALLDKAENEARLQQLLDAARQVVANHELKLENLQASLDQLATDKGAKESELRGELNAAQQNVTELEITLVSQQTRLDQALLDKSEIEAVLNEEVDRVTSSTAELEAELARRLAVQQALSAKIDAVSGEKSQLLSQLEQEKQRKNEIANLKNRLAQELNESRVEISQLKNQMTVINLTSEVLFNSGSAQLKPAGKKVLSIIGESLNNYPDRAISIEGHTDNVPVGPNSDYQSNWELSAARSQAAVDYFQQITAVDPERLRVVGYGEHHPVASNETAEGRSLNRRIEIRILAPEAAS
jgi:chemotaxis protein MotB